MLESIELAWEFSFRNPQTEYIAHVGKFLLARGYIERSSAKSDVMFEFESISPENSKPILYKQVLTTVVAAYTSYIKATLSFILPANLKSYPKTIKIDLKDAEDALDLNELIVKSSIPEINSLGFCDYPSLKRRCIELGIYPSSNSRDLKLIERLIATRNRVLHFHPGSEFLKTGKLKQTNHVSERDMWLALRRFSRVVNFIERRAMKSYRVWSGFYMLKEYANKSGEWVD